MLSCQDCERYLWAFLDHALEVKERLDIEEHVRSCRPCTGRLEAEQTLRRFLRQHGQVASLPEDVKRQLIHHAIHPLPAPRWWVRVGAGRQVRDFVTGVAAAAVLLLAINSLFTASRSDDSMQTFVQEASTTYWTYTTQRIPPEVESTDDTMVTQWLNNHTGYQLQVPCITDQATRLQGGRLCRLHNRKSAALIYKRNGVDIMLFAFKGESLSLPTQPTVRTSGQAFYLQSVGGRPVAMWQRGGITYSLVGDLPPDELLRLAATVHCR